MATTYSTYRWGLCLLKVLAIENMPTRFLAHVYYGQTAGWIRTLLDAEVRLGPGNIVLGGDPPPHGKGHSNPNFSAHYSGPHPRRPRILTITRFVD